VTLIQAVFLSPRSPTNLPHQLRAVSPGVGRGVRERGSALNPVRGQRRRQRHSACSTRSRQVRWRSRWRRHPSSCRRRSGCRRRRRQRRLRRRRRRRKQPRPKQVGSCVWAGRQRAFPPPSPPGSCPCQPTRPTLNTIWSCGLAKGVSTSRVRSPGPLSIPYGHVGCLKALAPRRGGRSGWWSPSPASSPS
jgi:hypothetical protein